MRNVREGASTVVRFLRSDVWRMRQSELPGWRRPLVRLARILVLTVREFVEDRCTLQAASLTFFTLLSIVPAVALAFGIAKGFGFEKLLRTQIETGFPAQDEVREYVLEIASRLIQTAQGGMIAGIGLLVLFYTVVNVLHSMEVSFNQIWQVRNARSWVRKFTDYFAILLIAPILVAAAGSATITLHTQVARLTQSTALFQYISSPLFFLLRLTPFFLIWTLFTLVYVVVPNTRVRLGPALAAGFVAGTAYQLTQWVYINFQVGVSKYNAIYGSFAALPLFLVWIHVSWLIVLFGAELSFAVQHVDRYEYEPDYQRASPFLEKLLALRAAHLLVRNFSEGGPPLDAPAVSRALGVPLPVAHKSLLALAESGQFTEFRTENGEEPVYLPARDIHALGVAGLLNALERRGVNEPPVSKTPEWKRLEEVLGAFQEAARASGADRLLKDV